MHRSYLLLAPLLCAVLPAQAATVNASPSTVVVATPGNQLRLHCNTEGASWRVTDPPQVAGMTFPGQQLTVPALDAWQALGGGNLATAHVVCEAPGFDPQPVTVEFLGLSALGGNLIIPKTMLEVEAQQQFVIGSEYSYLQALGVIDPQPLGPGEAFRRYAMGLHMLDDGGEPKPSVGSFCTSFLNPSFKCVMLLGSPVGETGSPYLNISVGGIDIGEGYSEDVSGNYLARITVSRDPFMPPTWWDQSKEEWNGAILDNYPGAVHGDLWIHVDGSRKIRQPSAFFYYWDAEQTVNDVTYRQLPGTNATLSVGTTELAVRSLLHSYTPPVHGGLSTANDADFEQMELLALYQIQGSILLRTQTTGRTIHDRAYLTAEGKGTAVLYAAFRYRKTGEIGHHQIAVFVN